MASHQRSADAVSASREEKFPVGAVEYAPSSNPAMICRVNASFLFAETLNLIQCQLDGIRIIGEVTPEKVQIVQDADYIYREEIAKAGLDRGIGQYFAALTNMRSVGVMGDERTYDYAIALRAVNTIDFMTAEFAEIPWEVLGKVSSRIVNEVKHVNRVLYDCTGKPPATIEFE